MTILTASEIFRDYQTAGVPASGPNPPNKRDIRSWGTWLESLLQGIGPGLGFATLALLNADLAHGANSLAIVYGDSTAANNGLYQKAGASGSGSWTRVGDLPATIVPLTVTGGTANAIIATAPQTPLQPGAKLFLLTPTAANTTTTTIAINGLAAVEIKSALGNSLVANSLLSGSQVLMAWSVDHYQLLISVPVDASGILASAIAAQTAAAGSATSASGYATAAASSASALGNQVHQYDTRALAAAATIPVGVAAIKVTRYATGYPLSYATYIPGTSAGPMAFAEAGGHYWELDLSGGVANALWFGAKAATGTDDYTVINAAIVYCATNGITLGFPDGIYSHSGTLTWAYPKFKVIALGTNVIFKHTGTGGADAHSFNGLVHGSSGQGVIENVFGGANRIELRGNPAGGTGRLVYVNNWHQGEMKIRGRDAQYIFFGDNAGGTGQAAAVSSTFDVQVSANGDGVPFAVVPDIGMYLNSFFNCTFVKPIVEQCGHNSSFAIQFAGSNNNQFLGGTAESNLAGGLYMDTTSYHNVFVGTDFEANGTNLDMYIGGAFNTFINVQAAATTAGQFVPGSNNVFRECLLQSVTVNGNNNKFDDCEFVVAYVDNGSFNSVIAPSAFATAKLFLGGVGFYAGTGAPTLVAPQGSFYMRKDGSSTSTRMYINTNGSTGWTSGATAA